MAIRTLEELVRSLVRRVQLLERRLSVRGASINPNLIAMTGEVKAWLAPVAPDGWALCRGDQISRTGEGAALFAIVGTRYGNGNGTTTYNLPDFRGRTLVGLDPGQTEFNTLGQTGGLKVVTLTQAQMPSHSHTQSAHNHLYGLAFIKNWAIGAGQGGNGRGMDNSSGQTDTTGTAQPAIQATGGGGAHQNMPPYSVVNYIVKL